MLVWIALPNSLLVLGVIQSRSSLCLPKPTRASPSCPGHFMKFTCKGLYSIECSSITYSLHKPEWLQQLRKGVCVASEGVLVGHERWLSSSSFTLKSASAAHVLKLEVPIQCAKWQVWDSVAQTSRKVVGKQTQQTRVIFKSEDFINMFFNTRTNRWTKDQDWANVSFLQSHWSLLRQHMY